MKLATRLASAPGYAVATVTTAFCVYGYCRTGSRPIERRPSTRITRLTTLASTGRSMKMSVNLLFMGGDASEDSRVRLRIGHLRIRVVRRLHGVVDHDRRAIAQLELAGRHDGFARLHAFDDRDLVAARGAGRDEALLGDELRLAVGALALVLDDEHRRTVRVVGDGGVRQRHVLPRLALGDVHGGEDPGQEAALGVGDPGAHLEVPGRGVDLRLDRGHRRGERLARRSAGLQ